MNKSKLVFLLFLSSFLIFCTKKEICEIVELIIVNNSNDTLRFGMVVYDDFSSMCILDQFFTGRMNPSDTFRYNWRDACWENLIKQNDVQFLFVSAPPFYHIYDCETIHLQPGVLKRIVLNKKSIKDLKVNNIISYP